MIMGVGLLSLAGCTAPCPPDFVRGEGGRCYAPLPASDSGSPAGATSATGLGETGGASIGGADSAIDAAGGETGDGRSGPARTDPGWTLGDPVACESPRSSVRYQDVSERLGGSSLTEQMEYGIVAAWEGEGGWRFAWGSASGLRWQGLDQQGAGSLSGSPVNRFLTQDLDGDGALDLLIWSGRIEVVWSFLEAPESLVLADNSERISQGLECGWVDIAAGDLDGDGRADLLVPDGDGCTEDGGVSQPKLYLQRAARSFEEGTVALEGATPGASFDAYFVDMDGDGALDVYLCNDHGFEISPNQILYNDRAGGLVLGDSQGAGVTTNCMSTSFADLNGDGLLDMYVGGTSYQYLLVGSELGYVDYRAAWGIPTLSEPEMPWGTALVDLDNDGQLELLVASGEHSYVEDRARHPLHLFRQGADGAWAEASDAWGLPQETSARGLLVRDFNGDGVPDILAGDLERAPWLLLSEGCTAGEWLEVRAPEGTIVQVMAGGVLRTQLATEHPGYGGYGPSAALFGLGDTDAVDWVIARPPGGEEAALLGPLEARRTIRWSPDSSPETGTD